ncbi:STAS domain-containing protein [Actinoplanes hulinensis]|uniref:STAS domain-containing protein n=1 Tax=Actinoplanes hulinensis TaxID=1144547 RepID=A0ABS7BFB0_9ACTN|nr:STAS domain-containing protein [Actinoplanes hulinensis]MBW6439544.1 STAS domain-containing protein [Actinoplanes hulinensis]
MTQYPLSDCAVAVLAVPQFRQVNVYVAGDVDADAAQALSGVVVRVLALSPERVFVDLAEVAFAGAALSNFLAGLVGVLPRAMSVTVCRPRPMHQWILEVTGMARVLVISALPAGLSAPVEDGAHAL